MKLEEMFGPGFVSHDQKKEDACCKDCEKLEGDSKCDKCKAEEK